MTKPPSPLIEQPEELARLREDLIAFYRPVNSLELMAVERIALARQSILRAARLESSLFANPPGKELHSVLQTEAFKCFLRYQSQAERAYKRAIDELLSLFSRRPILFPAPNPPVQTARPTAVATPAAAAPSSHPAAPAPKPATFPASAATPQKPAAVATPAAPAPSSHPAAVPATATASASRAAAGNLALRL